MRYAKTPKGQAEIRSRSRSLSRPLRNVLLCVDGDRDSMALNALARACGAPADALQQLRGLGLITEADPPAGGSTLHCNSIKSESDPASDALGPDTLQPLELGPDALSASSDDYLRLYAHMETLVGEHMALLKAYRLQLKIEQCNTVEELRALLPELEVALTKAVGSDRARELLHDPST
ncbi:MAG: hypothetical protein HIU89_13450 [Proteobacteria bacterium]|nr:hypothetical protein [Pseudomonadota bacterium]